MADFNSAYTGAQIDAAIAKVDAITGTNTGDQTIALTGDVTGSGTGSFAATIAENAVDNTKAADMPANTIKANATAAAADPSDLDVGAYTVVGRVGGNIVAQQLVNTQIASATIANGKLANVSTGTLKGRATAGTGAPEDLTGTQATALLDVFGSAAKGLAPASGGGMKNFLRADGTWAQPGAVVSSRIFVVTGEANNGYQTIEAAIAAVNALSPAPNFFNPAQILLATRALTISSTITLPAHTSVIGQNCRITFTPATGSVFLCGGYNRMYGLEFVGGNAANTSECIDANDKTDISIIECHLYGGTINRMGFFRAVGANWIRINIEHCLTNLFKPEGYAFYFVNTSGTGRWVDTWLNDGFFDAYELTTSYGGNIWIEGGCQDFRIARSTIRGITAWYTGVRLGSNVDKILLWQCNLEGAPHEPQAGFDLFATSGSTVEHAYTSARRTLTTGATVVSRTWV